MNDNNQNNENVAIDENGMVSIEALKRAMSPNTIEDRFGMANSSSNGWQKRVVKFDPNWTPAHIDWRISWKNPSDLSEDDFTYPLVADGQMISVVGFKNTRKTLIGDAMVAAAHTDDLSLTCGFITNLPKGKIILKADTEQGPARIHKNRKVMVDALGLQADTLKLEVLDLAGLTADRMKRYLYDAVVDLKDSIGMIWMDNTRDFLPGRAQNDNKAVSDLYDFCSHISFGITEEPVVFKYTQHTNRNGYHASGMEGVIFDKFVAAQLLSEVIPENEFNNKLSLKYTREKRFPSFQISNDPVTGWITYEGGEPEDLF